MSPNRELVLWEKEIILPSGDFLGVKKNENSRHAELDW